MSAVETPVSTKAAEKPRPAGVSAEYPVAQAARLASRFAIASPVEVYDFAEKGNINQFTFQVDAGPADDRQEYLLQQINQQVFVRPVNVMAAMIAAIDAQKANVSFAALQPGDDWQSITLVPLRTGEPYLELIDRTGVSYWRLMVKIPDARTYKSLGEIAEHDERLRIAAEAGRGLALFGDMTSTVDATRLSNPLPGYRDSRNYFNQLFSVLEGCRTASEAEQYFSVDEIVRDGTGHHFLVHLPEDRYRLRMDDPELASFIELARREREFGLTFARELESGAIRTVAIHGDTKLDNFLFSGSTGRVKSLVDLDTILPHTWLSDWGDMARSLVNVAGEKETDMSRVDVDMDIYRALAHGFLGAARAVTSREVDLMVDAVQLITLELGVRFLADYLRGDSYFQLSPVDSSDLNKTRAMVQLTLFNKLRAAADECRACIDEARRGA